MLRDLSIRHARLVELKHDPLYVGPFKICHASFILIVSKVTLCNLTMADQITLTHKSRGGARNFSLRGPSSDTNILVKTNLHIYTHTYIYIN